MTMKYYSLNSGDIIPALGLGTWKSEPGEVGGAVREALRAGYRHIDCAAIYQNEAEVGQAIDAAVTAGEVRRDELWITSKLWNSAHRAHDVLPALQQTLDDLQLDYLDLYLVHWPVSFKPGVVFARSADEFLPPDEPPLSETWSALEATVDAGLCRNIGLSNFSAGKCREILDSARIPPAVNQVELHPILAQTELLDACAAQGIHLTAYSPLGSPDRPDALKRPGEPQPLADPVVQAVAERNGATPAQVLIAWAMQRGTSVIPKSVNPERIRQNFEATKIELGPEDMAAIGALDRAERIVRGEFLCPSGSPYSVEWLWA